MRHAEPRVDGVQPAGQVALARHRQAGPAESGDQGEQRAGRRQGGPDPDHADRPRVADVARTASATGAADAAVPTGPSTDSTATATTAYTTTAPASAITIARGITRAGSRTSSPSVAIRA